MPRNHIGWSEGLRSKLKVKVWRTQEMKMRAWTTNTPLTGYPTLGLNKETAEIDLRYGVSASVAEER